MKVELSSLTDLQAQANLRLPDIIMFLDIITITKLPNNIYIYKCCIEPPG